MAITDNLTYIDYLWTKKSDDGSSIEGIRLSPLNLPTDVIYTADLPTALPNPKALTFGSKTYNGSTAQTITASDLGALTKHQDISSKVNKSGDTMTGSLTIASGSSINVSQYNDAGGVSLMNNGGGTATQFGSSQRPARLFSSTQPEWYKNGASQGVLALKSDISTVNNATLTIQQNSKNVATFTANSSTNATANIIVPSKTSELTNDAGFTTNTGTITEIKVNGTSKGTSGSVNLTNMVTFASSQTANVAGVNKTTYTYNQPAGDSNTNISNGSAYFPEGIIMGGTAASAGLVTRGICGVATPDATTGACAKENLYLNYDGDNSYRSGRQVVLQAGTTGEHYGHNLYQYAAARGDAVKGYVDSKIPTALKNPNALTFGSKTYDGSSKQTLTLADLGGQAAGNYVTTDTTQTISGFKTFSAPANVAGQESATVKIKTSNGGAIIFGKEGANSGSMIRLDQEDGTTRLQFRASATPGAMVWKQPESGAALYFDFGPNAARTTMPTSGGTLAYTSQIPSVGNGTLIIQKNGTEVAKFTANSSSNVTANISVPTITKQTTTGISASFAGTSHTHSAPTITVNSSNTTTNGASNSVDVYSSITGLTAAITTSYNSANKKLTISINSYPSGFGTTAVATSAHTHTYSKVTGATASAIAASTAGGTITITDSGHTHNI